MEHSVSERPRLTVPRPERARRRSTVDVTNGYGGHALPVSASRVPFPSISVGRRSFGGRPPRLCGEAAAARRPRTGRARADGERRRAPRVPAGVVRGRPREVQRVARARLDRPRSGWRASCCFGGATSGRPGVVFQFRFVTRLVVYWLRLSAAIAPRSSHRRRLRTTNRQTLLAVDHWVRASMKSAASCVN